MANAFAALNLGNLGTSVQLSSLGNCSAPSTAPGVYAVWATTATAFITTSYSTALTVTTGFPVLTTEPPTMVNVPLNGQIFGICATASSAVLTYMKVG